MQRVSADNRGGADERGESIDICSQHRRNLPYQYIADHSAPDPGQRAEENGRDRARVIRKSLIRARGDEEAEPGGVEQQNRAAQPVG